MQVQITGLDSLGAIIALIVISIGGLVLATLGGMMIIGAVMPKRTVITSWPAQQEASFATFDQRTSSSQGKAWVIAGISSVAVFFITVIIMVAVPPEKHDIGKTMNMSNLTKKDGAGAPKAAPPPKKVEEKKVEEKKDEPKAEEKKDEKKEEPKAEEKKPAEKPAEKKK